MYPTILDVLSSVLGQDWHERDVHAFSDDQIADLISEAATFYESWQIPERPSTELRVFAGYHQSISGSPLNEQSVLSKLLYFDRVVIADDLASYHDIARDPFAALRYAHDSSSRASEVLRRNVAGSIEQLALVRPLVTANLVLPVPATHIVAEQIDAPEEPLSQLVDAGCRDPAFLALASEIFPIPPEKSSQMAQDKFARVAREAMSSNSTEAPPSIYLASLFNTATLLVTDKTDSLYLPSHWKWWMMLILYLDIVQEVLARTDQVHLQVAETLLETDIPFFSDLSASLVLELRKDDEDFAAWRTDLRQALSGLRSLHGTADFKSEAEMMLGDLVLPRATAIRKASQKSHALRNVSKDPAMGFAIGAATATGELAGLPVTGSFATAAATALGAWGLKMLFRERPSGTNAVLARLINR